MSRVETFLQAVGDRSLRVGVVGMGYVGFPISLGLLRAGFRVLGFDVDAEKVGVLSRGESYIHHIESSDLADFVAEDRFAATNDFSRLAEADAILICVPTPLTPQRDPDLSFVRNTFDAIARSLRPGQLVVLESTTFPGTTDEALAQLRATGLEVGRDFFLAYSPEREDPGNRGHSAAQIPKVVGGVEPHSTELAAALYRELVPSVVVVSSARAAEATKLTENVFRAVNIALVNELKVVFERMGIDIWEVLDAAESKPFGFMRFDPGPGWGGHCIPVDPFYLSWKAREFGISPRFIELAGEVNIQMAEYVVRRTAEALNGQRLAVKDARVLVLGLAYKRDIDDARESPAFEIMHQLLELGAQVDFHDPHIPETPRTRKWPQLSGRASVPLTEASVAAYDVVIVITDHSAVDYALVERAARLIVDTRGRFRGPRPHVVRA